MMANRLTINMVTDTVSIVLTLRVSNSRIYGDIFAIFSTFLDFYYILTVKAHIFIVRLYLTFNHILKSCKLHGIP
jgi:hypothetical protein